MSANNGILAKTSNLIRMYVHNCGVSQVPDTYHVWCAVSLIAGCLSKNVWVQKFRGRSDTKLYPNLYTFLLGPSSIGKDTAANVSMGLIKDNPFVNIYRGELTSASLKDHLCKPRNINGQIVKDGSMYLITPELSDSIGSGPLADRFIKFMTDIYGCSPVAFKEGTRTHGTKEVSEPCVNWLGGSTLEWLMDSVPVDSIISGFFARVISVYEDYNLSNRVTFPVVPGDYDNVKMMIIRRLEWMCAMARGEYVRTAEAENIENSWFMSRPEPTDPAMIPIWLRDHDHVLKLAMVFAAADTIFWETPTPPLIIEGRHMLQAQRHMAMVRKNVDRVLSFALVSNETKFLALITDKIKQSGKIQRSSLLRSLSGRGVSRRILDDCLATLMESGQVDVGTGGAGRAVFYTWKKTRNYLGEVEG